MVKVLRALILLILLQLFRFPLCAEDWMSEVYNSFVDPKTIDMGCIEDVLFSRDGKNILMEYHYNGVTEKTEIFPIESMMLDEETGFIEFAIEGSMMYVILGNEYILVFDKDMSTGEYASVNGFEIGMVRENRIHRWRENYEDSLQYYAPPYLDRSSYSISKKSITTSGSYSEVLGGQRVNYDGKYIFDFMLFGHPYYKTYYNPIAYPWVEDSAGYGEWIEIDSEVPKEKFYVLNGFVDPTRPHLYRLNSRVKRASVIGTTEEGEEIEQEIQFEDFVYFKTIVFPKPVKTMRLIIRSVYPGAKWKDTAISALMLPVDWE
ncbi:NADase-type glycan-binding domain-containing protein [Sediminispirochaeta smaragdinae]|uniref:NAD glycohydrolase translocation F5/8 type C domain-containing protein n=1 Tax=Sediminispirochaeta smaragdinae (strain DSM 11293 / JCM 15392 / SEBR 4228) TaxID=573413 RepID=E1R175_SEDSS|nr:hypothetical protein [Sediminispirochaeta smaragdinae]ADK80895.1 hypothetical protein Spirs_1769 [Sediminispirochaeta smaragdinae DSM 11293]